MEAKTTKSRMAWQLVRVAKPSSWKFRAWPRSKYGEAELQISSACGIHDGLWLQWWSKLVKNKEDIGVVMSRIWKIMLQLVFSGGGLVTKSCPTLVTPWTVVCQAPLSMGFSVHGSLQARIRESVAVYFSRWSSQPRYLTWVSCIAGRFFTNWAMRQTPK